MVDVKFKIILSFLQNLIKTRRRGLSEGIDYMTLSKDVVKSTLLKVLEDPSYTLNAKKWSARFRDQKETPLERAVWHIEWLLRNPHCDYLKSPVLRLGFIAGNAYDIIACKTIITVVLVVILIKFIFICANKCTKRGSTNSTSTHKKRQ